MTKPKKHSVPSISPKASRSRTPQSTQRVRTPTPGKRIRASEFALKSSSKRRSSNIRRRLQTDLEPETLNSVYDAAEIDKVLHDVRELMRSGNVQDTEGGAQLLEALKNADEEFEHDMSQTSSTDEEGSTASKRTRNVESDTRSHSERCKNTGSDKHLNSDNDPENMSADALKLACKERSAKSRRSHTDKVDVTPSMRDHKRDVEALKKDDPEFYKFLEENDASLLELDNMSDLDVEGDESSSHSGDSADDMANRTGSSNVTGRDLADSGVDADESIVTENPNSVKRDIIDESLSNSEFETISEDVKSAQRVSTPLKVEADGESSVEKTSAAKKSRKQVSSSSKPDRVRHSSVDNSFEAVEKGLSSTDKMTVDKAERTMTSDESEVLEESVNLAEEVLQDRPNLQVKTSIELENSDNSEVELLVKRQFSNKDSVSGNGTSTALVKSNSSSDSDDAEDADETCSDVRPLSTLREPTLLSASSKLENDKTGYSSEDDDDALDELQAAAEAGIVVTSESAPKDTPVGASGCEEESDDEKIEGESDEPNSEDSNISEDSGSAVLEDDDEEDDISDSAVETSELTIVDTNYLMDLKERLNGGRSTCVKACKDALKILKAGQKMAPKVEAKQENGEKNQGKSLSFRNTKRETDPCEGETLEEGIGFSAGPVKFVSSKAYQRAMNLAIVGVQEALERLLQKPESPKGSEIATVKWDPTKSNRWPHLEPIFRQFVFQLIGLCESSLDPSTLRFLLKRMERLAPFTSGKENYQTKIVRFAGRIWSSDVQNISQETRLRAYLLLNRLARVPSNTELVLRTCFHAYHSTIANVCNPKTLPLIQFGIACLIELFGIDMGASYTIAFSYLRELAVSLRTVLVAKDGKAEIERVHNWSYVNQIRAWSKILGKYGGEDELRPLIYPLVQIAIGVMQLHPTPRSYPVRLHIASYLSGIMRETGVFIPIVPHLLQLLRCSELRKPPIHAAVKTVEWRAILRVSDEILKTKLFLTGIVEWVVLEVARYFAIVSKHVSFPELAFVAETSLKKAAKEVKLPEWKLKLSSLAQKLKETSDIIMDARSKADFSPHGAVSPVGVLAVVPGLDPNRKMPVVRLFDVEQDKMIRDLVFRDEASKKRTQTESDAGGPDKINTDTIKKRPSKRKKAAKKNRSAPAETASLIKSSTNKDEKDLVRALDINSDNSEGE